MQHEPKEARLFEISNITGTVKVDEVHNFSQEDLLDDDVMMLDTFTTVYIWIGSQAQQTFAGDDFNPTGNSSTNIPVADARTTMILIRIAGAVKETGKTVTVLFEEFDDDKGRNASARYYSCQCK